MSTPVLATKLHIPRLGSKMVLRPRLIERLEDMAFPKELVEAGQITTVIDRRYPLEQLADARR